MDPTHAVGEENTVRIELHPTLLVFPKIKCAEQVPPCAVPPLPLGVVKS